MSNDMNILQHTRLILGFLIAAALPGAVVGFMLGAHGSTKVWISLNGDIFLAVAPYVFAVAVPLYFLLKRIGQLRIYWAAAVGGVTAAIFDFGGNIRWIWNWNNKTVTFYEALQEAPAHVDPLIFFPIGAVCGVVGWLIAFGPRIAPRPRGVATQSD